MKFPIMKGLYLLLYLGCWEGVLAQTTDRVTTSQETPIYNDVSGSAFLIRDWSEGVIRFSSGRVSTQFKLKFDCVKNQLNLQFNGSTFATESKVKEFVLYTKNGNTPDSMVFRKGFPAADKGNEETYFQVLVEGKAMLLCLHLKLIAEEQQIASKVIYRRITDQEIFYLLKDGKMTELPNDKSLIVDRFPEHAELMRKYISEHQLKFRNAPDFSKLIVYYNTLL
jgi:hypothetical protein